MIEILLATLAASLIFLGLFGFFTRAVKLRERAGERNRETLTRVRALQTLREDLRGAYVSGSERNADAFAHTLEGGRTNPRSGHPGYLSFLTNTSRHGELQLVEYFISERNTLVRNVTSDLLNPLTTGTREQTLLPRVQSWEVTFYDGALWQNSWSISGSGSVAAAFAASGTGELLPRAIQVRIQQEPARAGAPTPPPLTLIEPWCQSPPNAR